MCHLLQLPQRYQAQLRCCSVSGAANSGPEKWWPLLGMLLQCTTCLHRPLHPAMVSQPLEPKSRQTGTCLEWLTER